MDLDDRQPLDFDLDFDSEPEEDDDLDSGRVLDLDVELAAPVDALEAPAGTLEVHLGEEHLTVTLDKPRLLIGRTDPASGQSPDVDLSADNAVSRRHAEIRNRDGTLVVVDLGSTNGTKLNGHPLTAGEERPLGDGDEVTLGERCRLIVRLH